jgi:hypothetical protein
VKSSEHNEPERRSVVGPVLVRLLLAVGFVLFAYLVIHAPLWFVLLALVAAMVEVVRLLTHQRESVTAMGNPTGVTIVPATTTAVTLGSDAAFRWRGGANMPGRWGRVYVSAFAVLDLVGSTLTLEIHPRLLGRWADDRGRLVVHASEGADIFPVSGSWRQGWDRSGFGTRGGIGLRPEGRPVCYFATDRRVEVLGALAAAGFTVNWEERRFSA